MHGPGYHTFPALYRSYIYYLSSMATREQFMQDPMTYLTQPSPKPVVPIRIAIIGPPKSGKSTCKLSLYSIHDACINNNNNDLLRVKYPQCVQLTIHKTVEYVQ